MPHKHWSSLSPSLESTCHNLISPIKCKADIGWPRSLRHRLGKKSSGLVLIKQPFVVRILSGLAAVETLRLGLRQCFGTEEEGALFYQGRVYSWQSAAGAFSSSAPSCSSSPPTGEESVVMARPGLALLAAFAVTLMAVTRTGRSPDSLCPPANVLHFSSEEGEAWREEQQGNSIISSLLCAVLHCSPAWSYQ